VDLNVEDPNLARLSIWRMITQDDQAQQIDKMFNLPMYKQISEYIAQGLKRQPDTSENVDLRFFFSGFNWMLYGLITSGVIDFEQARVPIEGEEMVQKMKDFLYAYCFTYFGIDG